MAKRKPFVNLKKGETENGNSMDVLNERPVPRKKVGKSLFAEDI